MSPALKLAPMPACCEALPAEVNPGHPTVALVGAPNVGKSTLFNALTGAHVTTGNWPGTSVDIARGAWGGRDLIDLPGAYSLDATSPDEALTRDLVNDTPAAVLAVVDAAHLARSLYLVSQLRERALRLGVVVTMNDVAASRGISLDLAELSAVLGVPVVAADGRRRGSLDDVSTMVDQLLAEQPIPPRAVAAAADSEIDSDLAVEDERFCWIEAAVARSVQTQGDHETRSDKVDRYVTHPVMGPLLFLGVMWIVFQLTTTVAKPLQDGLGDFFGGPVTAGAQWLMAQLGLGGGIVEGFIVDGLIAGVGMVLTFVPLMAIMFVLLALLEDSGYLARAAVVTDGLMRRIGLPGRAFLPFIVGFGCNVPAISATRILPNPRQRIMTALLVPFTACSARLTVFVMIGSTFFGPWAGTVVFGMYVLSIVLIVLSGLTMKATLWRTMGSDPLVLDLPPYQRPTVRLTSAVAWMRLKGFLKTATGIIVAAVVVVWLLQSIPAVPGASFGEVAPEDSVFAAVAKFIAPIFAPTGFGAWQTVAALGIGFIAKETVLSSWAQTYAVGPDELGTKLLETFAQSSGGHPTAAVLAFLVFMLAYTPCVATLAAQRREIGLRWTFVGLLMQFACAYVLSVLVFQIGSLL